MEVHESSRHFTRWEWLFYCTSQLKVKLKQSCCETGAQSVLTVEPESFLLFQLHFFPLSFPSQHSDSEHLLLNQPSSHDRLLCCRGFSLQVSSAIKPRRSELWLIIRSLCRPDRCPMVTFFCQTGWTGAVRGTRSECLWRNRLRSPLRGVFTDFLIFKRLH